MPPTYDIVVRLNSNPAPPTYTPHELPFSDVPRSSRRIHIALVCLQQLQLMKYDAWIYDPTVQWQFYIKAIQPEHCLLNFRTLRHLKYTIPDLNWQVYPLVGCQVQLSHSNRMSQQMIEDALQATIPPPLQDYYQHRRPTRLHLPPNPGRHWLTSIAPPPKYHLTRPPWLAEHEDYAIVMDDQDPTRWSQQAHSKRRTAPARPHDHRSPSYDPTPAPSTWTTHSIAENWDTQHSWQPDWIRQAQGPPPGSPRGQTQDKAPWRNCRFLYRCL